ncbi:hypothetical protein EI77_03821 [Prosthecobacter fusiformis]|uniref:Uncharacterized protein n=1 Tax=Prosthecobacter fusiformis TaxID=48464 RepID=A0A4R7RLA4_9BACT|nr:hypothetical protein [Prosthecobacter fusiformis]TDU66084.1 hypothetical protein EI77_03821 [Prosthecobacter fusiformis]
MTDPQLDLLLQSAVQAPSPSSSLVRDVWRDIEHRQLRDDARQPWLTALFEFFSLPTPRLAIWALALGIGIFAGIRSASRPPDPVSIYAHSINPLAPALTP